MSVSSIGVNFYPLVPRLNSDDSVQLGMVREARGDIKEIRFILKGSEETCLELFRKAEKEDDVISQIQLSQALFGMKWGKDHLKDFSSFLARDLEEFDYYPSDFAIFNAAYDEAMGIKSNWRTSEARGLETFRIASNRGYLPAFLELIHKDWGFYNSNTYGFAVQLKPYVGKGDRQLDYYFGKALKNGCQIGSKQYYEGLYWMNQSCGIPLKYPRQNQNFEDFKSYYTRYEDRGSTYYNHDGFLHVGSSVILAPSKGTWETFVQEKLENVRIAPLESYIFQYDPEQIKELLNQYKIGAVNTSSFIESPIEGAEVVRFNGKKIHGFRIDSLSMYLDHNKIGEISVQENTFKIHKTIEYPEIQMVIEFIENVMARTGSAHSAHAWLRHMGGRYI